MRIQRLLLTNFKRFTHLELDIAQPHKKLIVLIGPNGCGKSSVFDGFAQIGGITKPGHGQDQSYLQKNPAQEWQVQIETDRGIFNKGDNLPKYCFYIRSSYRFDPEIRETSLTKKEHILEDAIRPKRMIDLDRRVQDNYERMVGSTVAGLYSGAKDDLSVPALREELIGKVRDYMSRVFPDLIIESVGNPLEEAQFFFTKGAVQHFPYKNLSAGEKGAFDLLLDLIIKTEEFNNTVIAIDEPELHMHSALQRDLLKELYKLITDQSQLWVATHSIGFIRGSLELLRQHPNEVALFDLSNLDFDQAQLVTPLDPTSQRIRQVFAVAMDDLATMIVPSKIIICEGSLSAPSESPKREFDTKIYNTIFSKEDALFISGDNKATAQKSATLLFKIITQAGAIRGITSLVDRDTLTAEQIEAHQQANPTQIFLARRTIENYLFDPEMIERYCASKGVDISRITVRLNDVINDDVKPIQSSIMNQCEFRGTVDAFKLELAQLITPDTQTYIALRGEIGI